MIERHHVTYCLVGYNTYFDSFAIYHTKVQQVFDVAIIFKLTHY